MELIRLFYQNFWFRQLFIFPIGMWFFILTIISGSIFLSEIVYVSIIAVLSIVTVAGYIIPRKTNVNTN